MSKRDIERAAPRIANGGPPSVDDWPRIRGGLMSLHLLALTTTVLVHATTMLSVRPSPWGHILLAILLVPLTLETTKRVVRLSQDVATQLQLASGMSLITLSVLLSSVWISGWVLVAGGMGAALLLYGHAADPSSSEAEGQRVSSPEL